MSDQATAVSKTRPRRGVLLWSLALNVFLICGVGAFLLSSVFRAPVPVGKGGPARQFEVLADRLPADDASLLRREFTKKASAIDEAHTAAHRTRDKVRLALSAEPYNEAAAREAMSAAEAAHIQLNRLLLEVILAAAEKMTPAGRLRLAEWQPGPPPRR
jgi:uncharacterized membrane protein